MKYVVVRCEDGARPSKQIPPLLEVAKVPHLQQLAQSGAVGRIASSDRSRTASLNRFELCRGLFGLGPLEAEARPGRCYAAELNVSLSAEETAWCCEFVTRQDDIILDATAGGITTRESRQLIDALNERCSSTGWRWVIGTGSHHLFIAGDARLHLHRMPMTSPPESLVGENWRRALPRGSPGRALEELIERTTELLNEHPINAVRVDLGENPANMTWLWGPARQGREQRFSDRTGLAGALMSSRFPMHGLANVLQLDWMSGPSTFDEAAMQTSFGRLSRLVAHHEFVFWHTRVDSHDPVDRLCAMERIDRLILKPLTTVLESSNPWRILVAVDDVRQGIVPLIAAGSDMDRQPVTQLSTQQINESPLVFHDAQAVFAWLTESRSAAMTTATSIKGASR